MAGTLTITGMSAGENAGQRVFGPVTITGSVVIGETVAQSLASGDNTITVPAGAVACMVIPPTNNAVALKFRTSANSSDGGLALNPGAVPFVYPFPASAPTSVILNAASTITNLVTVVFI
jgi:hypothetical protein